MINYYQNNIESIVTGNIKVQNINTKDFNIKQG